MIHCGTVFSSGTYRPYIALMTYTIANIKGSVGKTTTAVYLAALAALHTQTILIDSGSPRLGFGVPGERPVDVSFGR